jgi:predicted ThiF/HesA family dinucleotide-utilizing enzyme
VKLSFVAGAAVGYVLGARAGRERYEAIVRFARKVVGSQTVQSTAGVLQAQVDELRSRAKDVALTRLHGGSTVSATSTARATRSTPDGHRG